MWGINYLTQFNCFPQDLATSDPRSGRGWSLLDIMNHFKASAVAAKLSNLSAYHIAFENQLGGPSDIKQFADELTAAAAEMRRAGMKTGAEGLERIHSYVISASASTDSVAGEARHAVDILLAELRKRRFLRVGLSRAKYLDKDHLFGPEVAAAFRLASADIKEAGNCLAAECSTAAVFHLMRAAEVGLRALAADRQITFPKGTLDSKQWGEILTQLDVYAGRLITAAASNWPSEEVRQAQIRFYQQAMIECRAFNDAWRRHISHAHEGAFYDIEQATSVMNHTRRFMRQLATKISEHTPTAEFWASA